MNASLSTAKRPRRSLFFRSSGPGSLILLSVSVAILSCAGNKPKPDFGTLPQVTVPIERRPKQDPTLFREKKDHVLPPTTTDPPDPKPLRSRDHFEFVLKYQRGTVSVLSVKPIHLEMPESSTRNVGRFALELWSGAELVDRVRFDFPLLGASQAAEVDPIESGLSTQTKVRIPSSARPGRARILDRKTRKEVEIPWPPGPSDPAGKATEPEATSGS